MIDGFEEKGHLRHTEGDTKGWINAGSNKVEKAESKWLDIRSIYIVLYVGKNVGVFSCIFECLPCILPCN